MDRPLTPAIILVEPQMGENIGAAARAMANFGLDDLRLVAPRDGWPNEKARAMASRADHVIDGARVYASVAAAIADLGFVYATTARARDVTKDVHGPAAAAARLSAASADGVKSGLLFGRERFGLSNAEVALCDAILTLPVVPDFASLNIAQAVLIIAYEWRKTLFASEEAALPFAAAQRAPPASKEELLHFFAHLESALEARGFFRPPEKTARMIRNLRALFQRAGLTAQEVRTLRGVITALTVFAPREDAEENPLRDTRKP